MNSTIGHPTDSSSSFCPTDGRCFYFSLLLFPSFSFSFSLSPYDSFTFLDSCWFSSPPSLFATAPSSFSSTRGQRDKVNVNGFFAPATADFSFSSFIAHPACFPPDISSCRDRRLFSFTRFRDYDENLTSAKVAPVRHISHFSGTGFLANAFFRLAKPELAAGWLQKSLFRHPCVKRPTSAKPNSRVSRMNEKYLTMLSLLNVEKKEKFGKFKDITSAPFFANIPSLDRTILFPFFFVPSNL